VLIVTHIIIVFIGHKVTDAFVTAKLIVPETHWNGREVRDSSEMTEAAAVTSWKRCLAF
jgi:hypothetical protein